MTTEDRIMMAPTERSMPAVRMTSVCAMPSMAMIVTCCRTSDRLSGDEELARRGDARRSRRRACRTMNGIVVGYWCRKCWSRRTAPRSSSSKLATVWLAARQARFGRRPTPPRRRSSACSSPRRLDMTEGSSRAGAPLAALRLAGDCRRSEGRSAPAELQAFLDRDRRSTPSTGLSVISVAPVSRKPTAGSISGSLPEAIASSAIAAIL